MFMRSSISCFFLLLFLISPAHGSDPFKPPLIINQKNIEKTFTQKKSFEKKDKSKTSSQLKNEQIIKPYENENIVVNMVFNGDSNSYAKVNNYLIVKVGSFIGGWRVVKIYSGCIYLEEGGVRKKVCVGDSTSHDKIKRIGQR